MKHFFFIVMFFIVSALFASAPLTTGFAFAPKPTASAEEKELIYAEARKRVINSALKYENVPYRYGGMTPSGLDCSGLICLSFDDALGISLPRSASALYSWAENIPFENAQPGDLLFFKTGSTNSITHVALYLGNRTFIHSASSGAKTGVIYTTLDEGTWARNFAGAGRVFPEVPPSYQPELTAITLGTTANNSRNNPVLPLEKHSASASNFKFLFGAAFAPTWNGFFNSDNLIRGFTSQFRFGVNTGFPGIFGLELRPEYDGTLGVFRLPLTLSWGPNDKYRIFAGPVLSFGDASISTNEGERYYSGGTSWFGTAGITAAPFILKTKRNEFAPYLETAWQSYSSNSENSNLGADFKAGFRFSTGLRWTMKL